MNALDIIRAQGVVAIVRSATPDEAATAVRTLVAAGLRAVEVSLVTPDALGVVERAIAESPEGVAIGVGTVLSPADAEASARVGAQFIVSPAFDADVIRTALANGMDVVPGVATPTEAVQAVRAGATAVKLFPASLWSPDVLHEVLVAMPWLETVPTGGVTAATAPEWIRSGAVAVGIGSALTRAADPLTTARDLLSAIASARSESGRPA